MNPEVAKRLDTLPAEAEVRAALPGIPWRYGIDHRGPYARVGDSGARSRAGLAAALRAALAIEVARRSASTQETEPCPS